AVLALTNSLDTPIICNGFKDDEFIKMTVLARKIGKNVIPVIEKFTELETLVKYAKQLEVRPVLGVRVKLAARGAGRWKYGAGFRYLDVGGGLGIDYDGSQTDFESSVNYTLQEYANDVVFRIKSVCDESAVPHPTIISESGRAVVAYHSVLVFDVLGVSNFDRYELPPAIPDNAPRQVTDLFAIHHELKKKNLLESYHDAVQAVDDSLDMFSLGSMS